MQNSPSDHRGDTSSARGDPRGASWWSHVRRCLGWRLVFFLATSLIVLMGARDWISTRLHREQMEDQLEDRAYDIGETLLFSTRAAMLANDWPRLEEDLANAARLERVVAVRIIGKDGVVGTSTDPGDIGRSYSLDEVACRNCHVGETGSRVPLSAERLPRP